MGRRTATQILEMRGSFKANPQRARPKEPKASRPFRKAAPRHLTEAQRRCWKEIVQRCPAGVLTNADEHQVELVAVLLAEFRADSEAMPTTRLTLLGRYLDKLGLSPSGRASLTVGQPKGNDFDDV
ncbi:terminase [Thiohalobacter thiocyanaticus]|uniref:Terminase n=1 Tax=Thiohalobacter thiocyanaticus TaxID=585455 RepID=A0A426QMD8_9GAMM|nr:terminase [Thiohalobacter thiocyanaticus]RRQ22909.1 terminase [Thiohalobacter thiocyanaticus]